MACLRTLTLTGIVASLGALCGAAAQAGLCDYKPTIILEKTASTLGTKLVDGAAAVGRQSASYYTLSHAGSAIPVLETAAASATGTVTAILMAPATMIIGGITIIGVGAYEGACYFQVDRVTDPYEVRRIIESVAAEDPAVTILRTNEGDAMSLETAGDTKTYLLRKLYIADGQLKHRDFGRNTDLGPILYRAIPQAALSGTAPEATAPESPALAPTAPNAIESGPIAPQTEPQPKTTP